MNRALLPSLVIAALFSLGCARPALFRRYDSARDVTVAEPDAYARLSAFVLDEEVASSQPFVLSLGPQAQASFIVAVSAKTENPADLMQSLATGAAVAPAPGGSPNRARFAKRLVLSVEKTTALKAGDRIAELLVGLTEPTRARFVSWDKFATQYETVDLGKITFQGVDKFEAIIEPGTGADSATAVKGRLGSTGSRDLTEELSLRQRYVGVTGTLRPDEARLYQEGIVGIDLAGNATLDLVIQATPAPASHHVVCLTGLKTKNAWEPAQDKIAVATVSFSYPAGTDPIRCRLSGEYVVRQVTAHRETIIEGDDTAVYARGRFASTDVELVSARDLAVFCWRVEQPDEEVLYLQGIGPADFASFDEARSFLLWLQATGNTAIGGHQLRVGGNDKPLLDQSMIPSLRVKVDQINR